MMKKFTAAWLMAGFVSTAFAQTEAESLQQKLQTTMPSMQIESVKASEIKGLYEVSVGSDILYVSADGRYLIQGKMFDIVAKKEITEEKLKKVRANLINAVPEAEFITFKAAQEKYRIHIFTDIECGYCRKLHSEIEQYLAEGITIQYLFYPRAGKGSGAYNKAVSVWCSDDKNAALTTAKSGNGSLATKVCKNPVDAHMALGESLGVRGTPMMITETGTIFPGYMPAKQLAQALSQDK